MLDEEINNLKRFAKDKEYTKRTSDKWTFENDEGLATIYRRIKDLEDVEESLKKLRGFAKSAIGNVNSLQIKNYAYYHGLTDSIGFHTKTLEG